jgi:hypothetical protein
VSDWVTISIAASDTHTRVIPDSGVIFITISVICARISANAITSRLIPRITSSPRIITNATRSGGTAIVRSTRTIYCLLLGCGGGGPLPAGGPIAYTLV